MIKKLFHIGFISVAITITIFPNTSSADYIDDIIADANQTAAGAMAWAKSQVYNP